MALERSTTRQQLTCRVGKGPCAPNQVALVFPCQRAKDVGQRLRNAQPSPPPSPRRHRAGCVTQAGVCATAWAQPADSRQLGRPGAWELYKPVIIGGILGLLVLQAGLLAGLLVQRSRRRQSEHGTMPSSAPCRISCSCRRLDGVYLDCHAADPGRLLSSPEQFLGRNMRDVLPPAALREIEPAFAQAAGTTEPVVVEYDLDLSDGQRRFEARLVRSNNNQILPWCVTSPSTSEAEAALRESAQRYALATTAGAVGVWDWNFDANELYVDPDAESPPGFRRRGDHEPPGGLGIASTSRRLAGVGGPGQGVHPWRHRRVRGRASDAAQGWQRPMVPLARIGDATRGWRPAPPGGHVRSTSPNASDRRISSVSPSRRRPREC